MHGTSWDPVGSLESPWDILETHGFPWDPITDPHGIPWMRERREEREKRESARGADAFTWPP